MIDKNNIEDEPENIPNLKRSGNKNSFKPDADYFDDFASRLQNRIDQLEEIKDDAPILLSIPKYNPFEVPSDYFDELPTLIQKRCITRTTVVEWFYLLIKPRFVFPFLITLFIAFSGIRYFINHPSQPITPIAEEINIDEQLQTIDETTIIDELTAEAETTVTTESENDIIVNYLIENNVDETNFNNEL
jgi:hypothetical protein